MLAFPVSGQLILTEFMADNDTVLTDEDGDFEDWIEIHNPGAAAVDLAGWSLTDDAGDLVRWMFPATNLQAGAYLVVFASGKDRAIPGGELHTDFKLASGGEYLALVASNGTAIATEFASEYPEQFSNVSFGFGAELSAVELLSTNAAGRFWVPTHGGLGSNWTATVFNDASWTAAANGVGYDTGTADPAEDSYAASVAATGPVLYWRLGETNTSTAANLGSFGAAAEGAYQGDAAQGIAGPRPPDIDGFEPDNLATGFDGVDDIVTGPPGFLSDRGAFAMAGWIRPNSIPFSSVGLFGQNDAIEFGFQGSQLNVWTDSGGATGLTYPFPPGEWHHALVQGTGELLEIYLDGVLAASTAVSTSNYGSPAGFSFNVGGVIWNTAGGHFDGAIDEVSVWHRALSGQEISNLLEQTAGAGIDYTPHIATDVEAAMLGVNASAYLRFPFQVTSPTDVDQLVLRMKYDDGFVAYLNGEPMASRYAPASPTWDATATARHPDPVAVQFETIDVSSVRNFLVPGANVLAIQGLNVEATNSDFLITAELQGVNSGTLSTQGVFMVTPTPGAVNEAGVDELGPLVQDLAHSPAQPADADDLLVTARITPTFSPVASVTLHYRVMFAGEVSLPMNDSGTGGDAAAGDGIWSTTIPATASSPGQMVRYYVTSLDGGGLSSRWPLFPDPLDSEEYLGTMVANPSIVSQLPVLHQFIENPGAADTDGGTRCSLYYNGEFYDNVRIDLHGGSTRGFPKKSYNLDFNRDRRFRFRDGEGRVKDIDLLTNYGDKAKVRNALAYDMIEASGSDGHFSFQVRVQRNTAFFSIADMTEDGDSRWLERIGRDGNGALYKMNSNLYSASGEKKTRREEGNEDLQALVAGLTGGSQPDQVLYAYDNLDLPQAISYFTGLALISSQDHGHKNYYVYRDSDGNGEWAILPWDVDLSWGRNWTDFAGYNTDTLYQDNVLSFYNNVQQSKGVTNAYYSLIFNHPDFRHMYLRRLRSVMDTILKPPGTPPGELVIEARIRQMMDQMDPPGVTPSDADLDYQNWGMWGTDYDMRADANRIINIHLPGRRGFLYNQGPTLLGDGIPTAQPANVTVTIGAIDYNPVSGNQAEEYIELVNGNGFAVDISGWELGDAVSHSFRPGTVIPAGASLYASPDVVAFRARAAGPGGGQGLYVQGDYNGQLNAWGETLTLTDAAGRLVATNQFAGAPSLAQQYLRITEIMYNPPPDGPGDLDPGRYEFLEVKNVGPVTLDLNGVRFSEGVQYVFSGTLAPGAITLVVADAAAFASRYGAGLAVSGVYTGRLDNGGEPLRLVDAQGEKIVGADYDNQWYPITDGLGFSLEVVDELAHWSLWDQKTQWRASGTRLGSPGSDGGPSTIPAILVNEALTHTDPPQVDTIELWNPAPGTVNVGGWFLTDDFFTPKKYRIPPGTTLNAGAYLPILESQFNPAPGVPPSFALSSTGDEVYLFSADASSNLTGYVHGFAFGPAANGVSFGRHVTSQGKEHFVAQSAVSLDGPNAGPLVGPVVLSEIMYHPIDMGETDNDLDEFIELRNISGSAVLLYDADYPTNHWRLRRAVDFTFPANTFLAAGEALLVVGFDPADATQAAAFRSAYSLAHTVPLFGPWQGKLDNSDESVVLERPDTPNPDGVPYILVEQVDYVDSAPWPVGADGAGDSLQRNLRNLLSTYGNDPANWFGSFPTPAAANLANQRPTVALTGPAPGASFLLPTNILLTADASDPDGGIARVEFYAGADLLGEDATRPYSLVWTNPPPGVHQLTARAYDNHQASRVSSPVAISVTTLRPLVSLTAPAPGSVFGDQEVVLLQATASDFDGSVVQVQFLRDGTSLGVVTAPPYELGWTATPTGPHALSAIVLDDSGLSGTSDVVQVTVVASLTEVQTLVPAGAVWRYLDNGSNQGTSWYAPGFDDAGWASGPAQLGYGDGDEATVVDDGPNNNRYITTYFRHTFVLPDAPQATALEVQILRDDGAIAYLNGVEIFRQNLPPGAVNYQTLATATVGGGQEDQFFPQSADVLILQPGINVLAAEIHQASPTNPDISFDARLILTRTIRGPAIVTSPTDATVNLGDDVTFNVQAVGSEPFSYQWTLNGGALPGADQPSLILTDVGVSDGGDYAVVVTNPAGSATSAAARLTVLGGDNDGDGLADAWENEHFPGVDILLVLPGDDPDHDLAGNLEEYQAGSDPNLADTDGDGLSDGQEIHDTGTDPRQADTDGDGLDDGDEITLYQTDPTLADSDGDSLPDGDEVLLHGSDPNLADTDGDQWNDDIEVSLGTDPTDPASTPQTLAGPGIGVNLHEASGGAQVLGPTESAGFVVQANWNNAAGDGPQPLVPVDRGGNPTSLDVRWSLSNTWGDGGTSSTDERLALGYFDDGDTPSLAAGDGGVAGDGIGVSVTVNNVPYARYAAVLYLNSDGAVGGSFGTYSVNSQSQSGGSTPGNIAGRGWVLGENLLMFGGLTNATCRIRVAARAGLVRGSLAAFQLIETPVRTVVLPPRIIDFAITPSAGTTFLEWTSMSGQVYQVQIADDPNGGWGNDPAAPPIPATAGTASWAGPLPAGGSNAVYRVIAAP